MSIAARGSVHSTTRTSPGERPRSALRVLSAGRGHFRPLRLRRDSGIGRAWPEGAGWTSPAPPPDTTAMISQAAASPLIPGAALTPLAEARSALLAGIHPVEPRSIQLRDAEGKVLAA